MNCIEGRTINDIWRDCLWLTVRNGYDYIVKKGSYEGQIRKQLDNLLVKITNPSKRPFTPIMPVGIPPTTSEEKIEKYFLTKIVGTELGENEDYTYGNYIVPQIDRCIELLKISKGFTNQACITIGNEKAISLDDPPCLKVVSFKVVDNYLTLSVFFRSWDAFCGMPENLGGLQLLKEYISSLLYPELQFQDGCIFAYSDGYHIYEQYFDIINCMNVDKINVSIKNQSR